MSETKGIEERTISAFWLTMIIAIASGVIAIVIAMVLLVIIYPNPSETITMTAYEWKIQNLQLVCFIMALICSVAVILCTIAKLFLGIMRIKIR